MKKNSYAKINLALNVTNKTKPKDFHDLDMLNVTISLCDQLKVKFIKDDKNEISIKCNNIHVPTDNKNLVYQVIEKFKKIFNLKFSCNVEIIKNIPLDAGLAGGSSNAAIMLNILDKHFKTNLAVLQKIAFLENITSDGPYMVLGTKCRVKGKGNKVIPLTSSLKGKVLVIKPFTGCSTKDVYNSLDYKNLRHPNINKIEQAVCTKNYDLLAQHVDNSLIDSACALNNDITDVLEKLKSCGFEIVSMSGSGSTCFAMSKSNQAFKNAKQNINPGDYDLCGVYKIR